MLTVLTNDVIGDDYDARPYLVEFNAGEMRAMFTISITNDKVLESDELFHLTIDTSALPDGITPGSPDTATVTIRNDDSKY